MTMHTNLVEYDTDGALTTISTQAQFKVMARREGIPFQEYFGGALRCLDLSLCPPAVRSLFDSQGFFIETEVTE